MADHRRSPEALNTLLAVRRPLDAAQLAAMKRGAVWFVRILLVVLALVFVLAAPGVTDRRQVLATFATMCATLLGLMIAVAAFVFRVHAGALDSSWGKMVGFTRGMTDFWRTMLTVVLALTSAVLASVFGLLDPTGAFARYLMVVAGIGLIYAVLFLPLLVGDLWAVLVISQRP